MNDIDTNIARTACLNILSRRSRSMGVERCGESARFCRKHDGYQSAAGFAPPIEKRLEEVWDGVMVCVCECTAKLACNVCIALCRP